MAFLASIYRKFPLCGLMGKCVLWGNPILVKFKNTHKKKKGRKQQSSHVLRPHVRFQFCFAYPCLWAAGSQPVRSPRPRPARQFPKNPMGIPRNSVDAVVFVGHLGWPPFPASAVDTNATVHGENIIQKNNSRQAPVGIDDTP